MTFPPEPAAPRRGTGRRAAIVGIGLIGGSIGKGLRRAGWYVTGADRDERTAARALAVGAIDAIGSRPRRPTSRSWPRRSERSPAIALEALAAGAGAVTDVGGVKASVVEAVAHPRFVGGHPMAGSELDGIEGADPDLFAGAAWVLTPTPTPTSTPTPPCTPPCPTSAPRWWPCRPIATTPSWPWSPTFPT